MNFSLLLFALVATLACVSAQMPGPSGTMTRDDFNDLSPPMAGERRNVSFERDPSGNGIQFHARSSQLGVRDRINMLMHQSADGMRVKIDYQVMVKNKANMDVDESKLQFKLRVYRLIEFTGTDYFIPGNSTILQSYVLGAPRTSQQGPSGAPWGPTTQATVQDGITSASMTCGPFTATGHVTPVAVTQIGADNRTTVTYSPNTIKMDFSIVNFPWTNSSGSAKLALEVRVAANDKVKRQERQGQTLEKDKKIMVGDVTTDAAVGLFDWFATADADGAEIQIHSTPLRPLRPDDAPDMAPDVGMKEDVFVFTFMTAAQPSAITWDPEVGMSYTMSAAFSLSSSSLVSAFLFAIVAAIQRL